MKKLVLWAFVLFIITWRVGQHWPVTVHISGSNPEENFSIRMPLRDKKRLDFFFREVCFLNIWAYTLLGSKPMSVDQYTKPWYAFRKVVQHPDLKDVLVLCFWPPHFQRICYFFEPREYKMKLGWEALNKYFNYFNNSRFVLYTDCCSDNETVLLTLIDKVQFIKTVKQHPDDFQFALENQVITPEDLIDNEKLYVFLNSLNHDGFRGTLLGYGRDNAWLFHKYREIDPSERPMISAWPEEELVNLEQLNQRTLAFQPWELSDLFYPRFACDSKSEETRLLKQTYREEREKIVEYFHGKDLVEAVLSIFNQKLSAESAAPRGRL